MFEHIATMRTWALGKSQVGIPTLRKVYKFTSSLQVYKFTSLSLTFSQVV